MGERALQDEAGHCEEQIAVGSLGPHCLTWLAPLEKTGGASSEVQFILWLLRQFRTQILQEDGCPNYKLQTSLSLCPSVLWPLGRKTHLWNSLKCEVKLQALPPQIPLPSRQGGLHGVVMKWSLMPQVWRKAVQSLERPVSSWDPGLVAQGGVGQQVGRTSYLLQLSLTISYSEMREQWGGGHSQGEGRPGVVSNSAPPPSSPASFIQS